MSAPRPVATRPRRDLLPTLRELLATADEAVLATAFVDTRGIHLVGAELRDVARRCRIVATSTFGGNRTNAAFAAATELGTRCRILDSARGTFHPKVVVARRHDSTRALVGSANLTAGWSPTSRLGRRGRSGHRGRHPDRRGVVVRLGCGRLQPPRVPVLDVLDAGLWELTRGALQPGDVIHTLTDGRPNTVTDVSRVSLSVETADSRRGGAGPQPIEPRMLDVAWAALLSDGELTDPRRQLRELQDRQLLLRPPGSAPASRGTPGRPLPAVGAVPR